MTQCNFIVCNSAHICWTQPVVLCVMLRTYHLRKHTFCNFFSLLLSSIFHNGSYAHVLEKLVRPCLTIILWSTSLPLVREKSLSGITDNINSIYLVKNNSCVSTIYLLLVEITLVYLYMQQSCDSLPCKTRGLWSCMCAWIS